MRKTILAGTAALPLLMGGCAGTLPANDQQNIIACGAALVATGATDPAALLATATITPACQALAADVINQLVGSMTKANMVAKLRR